MRSFGFLHFPQHFLDVYKRQILAYLSIGDRPQEVERLVSALAELKRRIRTDGAGLLSQEYIDPVVAASPQEAFYALSLIHILTSPWSIPGQTAPSASTRCWSMWTKTPSLWPA